MYVRTLALISFVTMATMLISCNTSGSTAQEPSPAVTPAQPPPVSAQPSAVSAQTTAAPPQASTASTQPLIPATQPPAAATPVDGKVDVGGYSLYITCTGQGSPTVILDAGLGGTHTAWATVQPGVAAFTRVCSYDRAGLGASDPGPTPRTSQQIVKELHTLLTNAGVAGPYVLVGHSFGGFNVRLYASTYRQDAAGLVLVESAQEDQDDRILATLPPEQPNENAGLAAYRAELQANFVQGAEPIAFKTSASEVRASGSLGSMPLIVLTAGQTVFPEFPADMAAKLDSTWRDLQQLLARLSSNSKQIIAERSGHCIQCTQPDLVIDAIRQVTEAARSHQPLAQNP
jgi:pimeloyl-ACP methyl ester carboxylesterase